MKIMKKKIHIISNRLPFSILETDNEEYELEPSIGGLATGMASIYKQYGGKWMGWMGQPSDNYTEKELHKLNNLFREKDCLPIHLSEEEIHHFYEGFSNRTIWPLFHYFTQHADFKSEDWQSYIAVNQKFADVAVNNIDDDDMIWVHDYQLLLVPQMIKEKRPNVTVGFFLHIPFPSFEVFRLLPWRNELISGMLGADLIGFHIYDYQRHFFSCVRRLLGHEVSFNQIMLEDRVILSETFPMGIDYNKFAQAAEDIMGRVDEDQSPFQQELIKYYNRGDRKKLILSIDRLDYTKGIPQRLHAFDRFLEKYPEHQGQASLVMVAVPSRSKVDHYQLLKKEVDELVGKINGKYGKLNYQPIRYFYRSLPFESLVSLYCSCDVGLITPVRDGMNLVAKEYVASRVDNTGVVILSEMAGVAKEMGEAVIINPLDQESMADAIHQALIMPLEKQINNIQTLRQRIQQYNVFKWAQDFVDKLKTVEDLQQAFYAKHINASVRNGLTKRLKTANKRMIFLDYDGTLTNFVKNPQDAYPDQELKTYIKALARNQHNTVTIISGRDKETLGRWFKDIPVNLVCEHGVWYRPFGEDWQMIAIVSNDWMKYIQPVMEEYVVRTPGSFIEKKNYSLVWHYRKAELDQSELRVNELRAALSALIANHNLEIMEGNKVIEVKNGGINKGTAAQYVMKDTCYDEIIAIGDDWTDEYMFKGLPDNAITIKVGLTNTYANYKIESVKAVRKLLLHWIENLD